MSVPLLIGLAAFVLLVGFVLWMETEADDRPGEPDRSAIRYQPDGSEAGPGRFRFPNNNQKDQQ